MVGPAAMLLGIGIMWFIFAAVLFVINKTRRERIIPIKTIAFTGVLLLLLTLSICSVIYVLSGLGHSPWAAKQTLAAFPLLLFGICICPTAFLFAYRRHCSSLLRSATDDTETKGSATIVWITMILSFALVLVLAAHAGFFWPPVMYMVSMKYPEARVKRMLELGFSPEAADVCGRKPLVMAAFRKDRALVKLLLEHGANPNQTDDADDPPPPLWWATYNKDISIAQLLISNKANPDGVGTYVPLLEACRNGDVEIVRLLVDNGAHVNFRNPQGTSLGAAAAVNKIDVMRFLIEKGADVENKDSAMGWTPLMYAASEGSVEAAKLLLEKGADRNFKDYTGNTPASIATGHKHPDVAELLNDNLK
jgi:hypothetical protein